PSVHFAFVFDGPRTANDSLVELHATEIREILRGEFDPRFPSTLTRAAEHTLASVTDVIDELLADPSVDFIVALGPLASYDLARRNELAKPSIAAFAMDPEVLGLPLIEGTSGVPNLSYVAQATELTRDFRAFREIVPFSTLTVLGNPRWADIPGIAERALAAAQALGIQLETIPVDRPIEEALGQIRPDAEAVYLAPLLHLTDAEWNALVTELNRRRLPTFSMLGTVEVELGVLATMRPETFFPQVARRVALNAQQILLGAEAGSLPVFFECGERLTVNMATARAIGRFPSWQVLTEANLLNEEEEEPSRKLSLDRVAHESVEANLDLRAQDRAVSAGGEDVSLARSLLLPTVEATTTGLLIDRDRAEASFGTQAERTLSGGVSVTQLLYSEPAWANLGVQRELQQGRVHRREEVRLDVALDALITYLDVLQARALLSIERDNVLTTRANLELARLRQGVGMARAGEVLRWESQIAVDRQRVIAAESRRNMLHAALNRVLHRPLEERFGVEEVAAIVTADGAVRTTDPHLMTSDARLVSFASNQQAWDVFRDFMVEEGLAGSPELRQLEAGISAQERAERSATHAFWAPTLALRADLDRRFSRGGAGSGGFSFQSPSAGVPVLPQQDDLSWNLGLSISMPVFTGGSRFFARARANEALEQLRIEREAVAERVEQRIRTSLFTVGASYMNVGLATQAVEASREHLELVRHAYRRGAVSITEVLDAQQAALGAEQA
ncbi:MAG: TolC family protein, partial [Gemmatimonadota bacterium]|nr:TolC family protein [Gemmatimonadota bacterium]